MDANFLNENLSDILRVMAMDQQLNHVRLSFSFFIFFDNTMYPRQITLTGQGTSEWSIKLSSIAM